MQPESNNPSASPSPSPNAHDRAVWIDHSRARVGAFADGHFTFVEVASDVEGRNKSSHSGGMPLPSHVGGNRGLHPDRQREEHLKTFYDDVIAHLSGVKRVVLLGPLPGAAQELEKRIRSHSHFKDIEIEIKAADRMSDHELADAMRNISKV